MSEARTILEKFSSAAAGAIPRVDAEAEHGRWQPGIGPFEEERQIGMIADVLADDGGFSGAARLEVPYPGSGRHCDLVLESGGTSVPVEAKLIRFRRDNGNIDPNMYTSVFSPFPEEGSESLLTDARKLHDSGFGPPYGLLGVYYEQAGEYYDRLTAGRIAEKLVNDIQFWYDIPVEMVARAGFDSLRHPHHQRGEIIAWLAG